MAPVLRRRLNCHYCGQKTTQRPNNGRFKCEHCLALNFLDEAGEVADVPAEELYVPDDGRYVDLFEATDVFCSICLKNQRLYTATLAESLPEPSHPRYTEFERALPQFKKKLDERYPQCCAGCEPRVRAKLQLATYTARADHMRRMLERSRARRVANRWGWRSLVVDVAGVGFVLSLCLQMLWHAMGSQSMDVKGSCFSRPVPRHCVGVVEQYVGASLLLALLMIWWNPKWQQKLKDEGRLVGLSAYYRWQIVVLIFRFGAWIWATEGSSRLQLVHAVALLVIGFMSGVAFWTVRVDTTPLVNWEYEQAPLVTQTQYVPPPPPVSFSIASLAPAANPILEQWRPPPPPINDSMDWTPSHNFDQPKQPRYRIGPTPFHSTIPAVGKQAIGLPPGHFDKRDRLPERERLADVMAEPKFFAPDADTGLENIFGQVFSLNDAVTRPAPAQQIQEPAMQTSNAPLVSAALLVLGTVLWSISDILAVAFPTIRLYILGLGVVPACRVAISKKDIISAATTVEVVGLIMIGVYETPFTDKLGAGILTMLTMQELMAYVSQPIPGAP